MSASTDGFYIDQYGQPVPPPGYDNRPRAGKLPVPQGRAQLKNRSVELDRALEFMPGRLYHYIAAWQPEETDTAHYFSVRAHRGALSSRKPHTRPRACFRPPSGAC